MSSVYTYNYFTLIRSHLMDGGFCLSDAKAVVRAYGILADLESQCGADAKPYCEWKDLLGCLSANVLYAYRKYREESFAFPGGEEEEEALKELGSWLQEMRVHILKITTLGTGKIP